MCVGSYSMQHQCRFFETQCSNVGVVYSCVSNGEPLLACVIIKCSLKQHKVYWNMLNAFSKATGNSVRWICKRRDKTCLVAVREGMCLCVCVCVVSGGWSESGGSPVPDSSSLTDNTSISADTQPPPAAAAESSPLTIASHQLRVKSLSCSSVICSRMISSLLHCTNQSSIL